METLNLDSLIKSFEYNRKALATAVTKLEKEAESIGGQLEARKLAQRRIGALEGKRADKALERQELREAYQDASFESDELELERITDLRENLDDQIAKLTEEINAERTSMPEVDSTRAVNVAVQRDMLQPISVEAFLDKLAEALKESTGELNQRIRNISVESYIRQQDYDSVRASKDSKYASFLAREKKLAIKDKARQAKLRPVSNTSDMADHMSKRKQPEDRMKWTHKGEKGDTLERAEYVEERSDVLSGSEVARILAEKQAAKVARKAS